MSIFQHTVHVYQRPKQGTGFIRRHNIYDYQHTIVNQGWFDTASCDIAIHSDAAAQQILEQYLGCFVAVYVNNPAQPIWEGLINRITYNSGGASYTISLDEMANRLSVVYTDVANAAKITTEVDNATSQAIYGIKQDQIEFGADPSTGTQRTVLRDTLLAQRAFPQQSITQAQGMSNLVHIECIGIFHTLEWSMGFTVFPLTTTTAFSTFIKAFVGADRNGATFYDNTNLTKIVANAATVPDQQRGKSFWEVISGIAEAGDASNYWVCGIQPTDRNTGKRVLYYRQANGSVEYTASKADGLKPRNPYGQVIAPWLVVPDRGIRVTDALLGFGGSVVSDPTITYIQSIQYDANSQRVQWFGADNTTARAAFLLNRGYKPISRDFGAPMRIIAT